MYCRQCGQTLGAQAVFCSHCGMPTQFSPAVSAQTVPGTHAGRPVRQPPARKKRVIAIFVAAVAVILLGLAVWQLGHLTGQWQRMALNRSLSAWERFGDREEVEDEVLGRLSEMADLLEQGQTEAALAYVHPDQQQRYVSDFNQYPEQIPMLVAALRSARLVLISEELDAYTTDRMVRVELRLPDEAFTDSRDENTGRAFTVTMVLDEDRWVIDS